eukprot:GHUV01011918.1.p1 GENE.GHUV01011918.1~~GHUV01011918.1.p1  ORF type:complete len:101 (-),score=1.05 GHUV01011918.1:1054-1356(-)
MHTIKPAAYACWPIQLVHHIHIVVITCTPQLYDIVSHKGRLLIPPVSPRYLSRVRKASVDALRKASHTLETHPTETSAHFCALTTNTYRPTQSRQELVMT